MDFLQTLKTLLVIAFGKRTEVACSWSPVPLMRRTTPSGGSRHPTEGYLVSYDIPGLPSGWYHIQADPCELVLINSIIEKEVPIIFTEQPLCVGMIILTSNFRRTMYRYREPRAFRVPHMDAGHMLTTIEIIAKELGIPISCHLNFNETYILEKIQATQLDEGVMAAITITTAE